MDGSRIAAISASEEAPARLTETSAAPSYASTERRGPARTKNVARPAFGAKAAKATAPAASAGAAPAKTGIDGE